MIRLVRTELLDDVAQMAYVAADLCEGEMPQHKLHQTFDVCEERNAERVCRVMQRALLTALRVILPAAVHGHCRHVGEAERELPFPPEVCIPLVHLRCGRHRSKLVESVLREYLVASALADWLEVTLPEAAPVWSRRAASALTSLSASVRATRGRRVPPI